VRAKRRRDAHAASFSGEVWTDGRGFATVLLPAAAAALEAFEYQLAALEGVPARLASEAVDGHFTIETDEPHVKVAWRLTARHASRPRTGGTAK
jgi:hypothetical protein